MANTNNLGCGPLTVKYLVFIFNFIFFISGLLLIIVGGIAQGFFSAYLNFFGEQYETPAIGIIILGGIILVISFFGCCGAKRENVFMLKVFAGLMVLTLILEFAAAITVAVMRPNIEELVKNNMNSSMDKYGEPHNVVTEAWDNMQMNYDCCGTTNYTDWKTTVYGSKSSVLGVPDSCCKDPTPGCGHNIFNDEDPVSPLNIYTTACYQALSNSARHNMGAIIGGIVGLAILQVIGIWMSCCLIRAVKERYEIL
ncbi:CD63 antigen-like [Portunus trituberculatus]|uniref:CD63 antigen-like n=1 Tax=Portunus trituberculatus TaxID=210409 RepID=UPI001E1D0CD6|nr:CD63 antigen-like [Portunus trituberculatus]